MVRRDLVSEFQLDEDQIAAQMEAALGDTSPEDLLSTIDKTVANFEPGAILTGKIVNHIGDDVVIEVGLKSEGAVSQSEFNDPSEIVIGGTIEVLAGGGRVRQRPGAAEQTQGRPHPRMGTHQSPTYQEGDTITGKVARRIKGRAARGCRRAGVPAGLRRSMSVGRAISRNLSARKSSPRSSRSTRNGAIS